MAHAEASRQFQEFAEFHASVAVDARVGREPGSVGVYEGLYDVFAEFAFERKDVKRYAEAFRDAISAGRKAYLSGLGMVSDRARASSPLTGFLRD